MHIMPVCDALEAGACMIAHTLMAGIGVANCMLANNCCKFCSMDDRDTCMCMLLISCGTSLAKTLPIVFTISCDIPSICPDCMDLCTQTAQMSNNINKIVAIVIVAMVFCFVFEFNPSQGRDHCQSITC